MIAFGPPFLAENQQDGGGFSSVMTVLMILFFVISAVRAMRQAKQAQEQHEATDDESDEERRAREIRERLRRVIAERRGEVIPPALPPFSEPERPPQLPRVETPRPPVPVGPLDPFGGPAARLEELRRKLAAPRPAPAPEPTPIPAPMMSAPKTVESYRAVVIEREGETTAMPSSPPPIGALPPLNEAALRAPLIARRREMRTRLLADLREPSSVRRAILLREVLGTPVGMRR